MRRIAAHYVFWKKLLPLHYIELHDNNTLIGVFPLQEEIAGTEFWDGIIYPVSAEKLTETNIDSLDALKTSGITDTVELGDKVAICQLLT